MIHESDISRVKKQEIYLSHLIIPDEKFNACWNTAVDLRQQIQRERQAATPSDPAMTGIRDTLKVFHSVIC